MSRFSKYLLLFLLINIASGTYFPSFSLSPVIRRCCLHHGIALLEFPFCWGGLCPSARSVPARPSRPRSSHPSGKVVSGSFSSKLGMQTKNFEISSVCREGFCRLCQSPGGGLAAAGFWFLSSAPAGTRYTPHPAKYRNHFKVRLSTVSTDMGK